MKNKGLILLLVASLVATVYFTIKSCNSDLEATNWKARYDTAMSEVKSFKNKAGVQVVEQAIAQFADQKSLKEASAKAFNLKKRDEKMIKKVDLFAQIAQELKISDSVPIYVDATALTLDSSKKDEWPKHYNQQKQYYAISGEIWPDLLIIDSLKAYDTLSFRVAAKRSGLFKPNETVIQAVHSSPYVYTSGITSMSVKHRTNAWNRWIKPIAFAVAGVAVGRSVK
jgi:hypothetical protein